VSRDFGLDLLSRIEDAGINASAPREQRWVDGWLVRFSAGKAKRARCIQPVAPGRLPVEEKLALCLPVFAAANLRPYVRLTPFSEPSGLDRRLEGLGMERVDDTRVMVLRLDDAASNVAAPPCEDERLDPVDGDRFARWIGDERGSTPSEIAAHAERLRQSPVPYRAAWIRDASERVIAGGQVAIEGDLAGLYDVFTSSHARGRGLGRRVCLALIGMAAASGARTAYLQVDADNVPARSVYRRLGFADAYAYHYRTPAAG
jgi:ribosomal protein S18 acetylase RimI-like enzyme